MMCCDANTNDAGVFVGLSLMVSQFQVLHEGLWSGHITESLPKKAEESQDEMERLPYLLRLLKTNDDDEEGLERIQDRAALYSLSEQLQVVVNYLSPHISKKQSREMAISVPGNEINAVHTSDMMVDEEAVNEDAKTSNSLVADDLEMHVFKVWAELHQLTKLIDSSSEEEIILAPDSILAQPVSQRRVGASSDLGSVVASIMHHSSLSHRRVAVSWSATIPLGKVSHFHPFRQRCAELSFLKLQLSCFDWGPIVQVPSLVSFVGVLM